MKNGVGAELPNPEEPVGGTHRFVQWTRQCKSSGSCGTESKVETRFYGYVESFAKYGTRYQADGLMHFWVDGVDIDQMDYSPSGIWTTDWGVEFSGETKHATTNIPGRETERTSVGELIFYKPDQLPYCVTTGMLDGVRVSQTYYWQDDYDPAGNCLGFKIWTNRRSSMPGHPDPTVPF